MWDRYGITILQEGCSTGSNSFNLVDETGIVGNLEERNQLIQWLTETNQDQAIISIWGMGVSGKTTLLSDIYKR
jgi:NB-ARC domain